VRICERNNSADSKVSEEGGGRSYCRRHSRDSPQHVEKITVWQTVPLQPMEVQGGAGIHL